jgi:hypothetical protein
MTSNLVGIFPKDMEVTAINGNDYMAFLGISPKLKGMRKSTISDRCTEVEDCFNRAEASWPKLYSKFSSYLRHLAQKFRA